MCTMKIENLPTFSRWIEEGVDDNDNPLGGYIQSFQEYLPDLVLVTDDAGPRDYRAADPGYESLVGLCLSISSLIQDLKNIQKEVISCRQQN